MSYISGLPSPEYHLYSSFKLLNCVVLILIIKIIIIIILIIIVIIIIIIIIVAKSLNFTSNLLTFPIILWTHSNDTMKPL